MKLCLTSRRDCEETMETGCRTGAKQSAKRRKQKPSVPAFIMGIVRSSGNKMNELGTQIKTHQDCVFHRDLAALVFPGLLCSHKWHQDCWADRDVIWNGHRQTLCLLSTNTICPRPLRERLQAMRTHATTISGSTTTPLYLHDPAHHVYRDIF